MSKRTLIETYDFSSSFSQTLDANIGFALYIQAIGLPTEDL